MKKAQNARTQSEAAKKEKNVIKLNKLQIGLLLRDMEDLPIPRKDITLGMITGLSEANDSYYEKEEGSIIVANCKQSSDKPLTST